MSEDKFEIEDSLTFEQNLEKFSNYLKALDGSLGQALYDEIKDLTGPLQDREAVLERLFQTVDLPEGDEQ